jgi:hypothetical protein
VCQGRQTVDKPRCHGEIFAALYMSQVDILAAHSPEVDEEQDTPDDVQALPIPPAARVARAGDEEDGDRGVGPPPAPGQRQGSRDRPGVPRKGCRSSEDALRSRDERWLEKEGMVEEAEQTGGFPCLTHRFRATPERATNGSANHRGIGIMPSGAALRPEGHTRMVRFQVRTDMLANRSPFLPIASVSAKEAIANHR